MILQRQHPNVPEVSIFIPLRYDRAKSAWVSLIADDAGYLHREGDAARLCIVHVVAAWDKITREAALMRRMCSWENFAYQSPETVDVRPVHEQAKLLARSVEVGCAEVLRLLQPEVDEDDEVELAGERRRVGDMAGTFLPLVDPEAMTGVRPRRSPLASDDLLRTMVSAVTNMVRKLNTRPLEKYNYNRAIDWLQEDKATHAE